MASDLARGTIGWDFDGTLVSRPLMWSRAAKSLLERTSIDYDALPGPLLEVLNNNMPWHAPNRAHPELSTPELWWARVFATCARHRACSFNLIRYQVVGMAPLWRFVV